MKYYLSNSQRRDLIERGALVKVVLPITADVPFNPDDQLTWAASVIADIDPSWVRKAGDIEMEIAINPAHPRAHGSLADRFGEIIWPDRVYTGKGLIIEMTVVLVYLSIHEEPRHIDDRPRWPHSVDVNGIRIPWSPTGL